MVSELIPKTLQSHLTQFSICIIFEVSYQKVILLMFHNIVTQCMNLVTANLKELRS